MGGVRGAAGGSVAAFADGADVEEVGGEHWAGVGYAVGSDGCDQADAADDGGFVGGADEYVYGRANRVLAVA